MALPIKKQPLETYNHYTIYVIVGIDPVLFIAEKNDPSKGITLTADTLDELKQQIDKTLKNATKLKINVWQGKPEDTVTPGVTMHINANGVYYDELVIVVKAVNYDLESVEIGFESKPVRRSKRYRNGRRRWNCAKFFVDAHFR